MAIEKMVLLNLTFDHCCVDQVLCKIKDMNYFYPESASKMINNVKGVCTLDENAEYQAILDDLNQIALDMKLDLKEVLSCENSLKLEKSQIYVKELKEEIQKIKTIENQLIEEKEENEMTLTMLEKLSLSEVSLDQLMNCHYVKTRFGRLKKVSLNKMKYYDGHPCLFYQLGESHEYVWCCYIVTESNRLVVDNIFSALGFEEMKMPSFVHGTIDDAKNELISEIHAMEEYILRMQQKLTTLRETHKVDLLKLYSSLCFLNKMEEYKKYIVDYQSKCAIYGFVPLRKLNEFKEQLSDIENIEFQELPDRLLEDQDINAPTVINNSKLVRPFEIISKVKQSDKIDTTIAFAVLYYFVFIIFLGDLGVGVLLALLGLLFKNKDVKRFILFIALATFIGGLMYGCVFYTVSLYQAIILPYLYRVLDGILILFVGTYSIQAFKKMYLEESLVNKILSIKGICGLICIYALFIYWLCDFEIHVTLPVEPLIIVIVACIFMILMKSMIKKKLFK